MTSLFVEPLPKRKRRKGPDEEITKNVVVLRSNQVCEMDGVVLMPKTTLDMSSIKKSGQSKKVTFTKSTSSRDMQRKLEEKFPFLEEANERFYCSKAVENRSKLDFCGDRCVWSGAFINKNITGNSALYIYCEEEKEEDSGHYSSDSDLSGAHVYGSLVAEASQGCKRFQSEPCSVAEGPHVIDKETLRTVRSQKYGKVIECDRNYTSFDQLEGVTINSASQLTQPHWGGVKTCSITQVTKKEAGICVVTEKREQDQCSMLVAPDAEKEKIHDSGPTDLVQSGVHITLPSVFSNTSDVKKTVPMTLPLAVQPTLPTVPAYEASVSALTEDKQQNTPVTVGASDNQIIELFTSCESAIPRGLISQQGGANSSAQNVMDVGSIEECLMPFDEEVLKNPIENPSQGEQMQDSGTFSTYSGQSEAHITLPPVDPNTQGDLPEQINSSTLASQMKSLQISRKDIEIQKSYDQTSIKTFTNKGSQSGQQCTPVTVGASDNQIIELIASFESEIHRGSISQQSGANFPAQNLMDVESLKQWLKQYSYEVFINPTESPLKGGAPCIFTFRPELPSDVNVKATFGNLEPNILEKTSLGYICKIPASPEMTPDVISVLISTTTGTILAQTFIEYCGVEKEGILQTIQRITSDPNLQQMLLLLYMRNNLGGKPGGCGSVRRKDGSNDGGASGGGASGGRASGGGSSREGASGSGNGTGGTGASGFGRNGCGTYGGGSTGCQYSRDASQLDSDVVSKLCELIQKCSVCIWMQKPSAAQNKACTEVEEDLEDDQLSCTQESNENYFADTEDCSSVSSETDSALSDAESWDESLSDSSLSFPWLKSRSSKSQEAIPETESTQHSHKAVNSKLDVSHEILAPMTEGFTSEDSIGDHKCVGSTACHKWNTSLPESKNIVENCEKDDHNEMQDSSQEWAFYSEALHGFKSGMGFLFEALHAENAKPKDSESILSVTSNQQSATHAGPTSQSQAAQSPVSNPLWNGDSKLNMAPPQCSDEEIHSGQEWEESGEGLASWFDLCGNEDAGKNEHSRWEMSSIEPNKTDGGVERDVFDSEEELSQEQGLFSEQGNSHIHLSLPDDTSVQSRRPEVENEEIQDTTLTGAARNGHTDIVRLLIENGADVNEEGRHTPLCEAARNGHTDIVRLLIESGADVNKRRWDIPLFEAARNWHTDIVRLLLENGAVVDKRWHTPLFEAARNGHTDIVRLLLENGADVNKGWNTLLCEAARNGHTDIVRLLIESRAEVNKRGLDIPLFEAARNWHTDIVRLLLENGAVVDKRWRTLLREAARNGRTDIVRLLIRSGVDVNKGGLHTPLFEAARNGHTNIVRLLIENGAHVNKRGRDTSLCEAARNGHVDIVRLLIESRVGVNKRGLHNPFIWAITNDHGDYQWFLIDNIEVQNSLLFEAARNEHVDIVRLLIESRVDVNNRGWFFSLNPLQQALVFRVIDVTKLLVVNGTDFSVETFFDTMMMKLFEESLRRKFEADARDTKLSLERVLDVQLRGKKIASLPKRLGKKLTTQTEMTSPRDIVEEGKCGKDSMTDVELGLNCLHLSPRCVQFKPFIMEESPGDSSIMHHDFKTINKRMDRVTLTDVGNAKQDHCVVVEKAKTHPNGDTIIIYGRKINEEGSSLGEVFQLATKDLKDAWEDEEMIAENVEIGSVVKYVQVGDDFLFQGNTKRPRWDKDRIFLGLSCTDGAHRGIGNAFPNSKRIEKDRYEGCTPKETSYFISLKCGVVENDRISVITKLGELFNLKLNCREDVILPLSPSTLELSHVEDNKDVVDGGDEPKEKSVEAENPEADPEEKDDENGNTF